MTTDDASIFADEVGPRRGRRLAVIAVVVVVAVLAAAAGTSLASGDDGARMVTARAGVQDIAAVLHGVATIEPVVQAAVAFPADGTVASVDVTVGDTVAVGQQLASLDLEDLTDDLHAAEASLAQAELTLSRALDGESVDSWNGSGGATAAPASTTAEAGTSEVVWAVATQTTESSDDQLAALQQAVLDAQQAVDRTLATSEAALTAAAEVCAADSSDAATTPTTTGADAEEVDPDACRTALDEVLTAQQATAAVQRNLATASSALDDYLLAEDASGSGGTTSGGSGAGGSTPDGSSSPGGGATSGGSGAGGSSLPSGGTTSGGSSAGGSTPDGSSPSQGGGSSTTSTSPSSAELVAFQQKVDAAALGVAVAQQAIAQATIVSPIAGTVVSLGVEAGDDVTAASSTQTVTVQGQGGMEAVTTVALDEVSSVQVGQSATVVPDGTDVALRGEVVAVAAVPDDDATTTSYRVTIGFADDSDELGNGTIGSVAIVTDDVRAALAVPSSAVRWQNGRSVVQVLTDGVATASTVEVGVVGSEWTEILSGVERGVEVVLADPTEPLPGSATDATSSGSGAGMTGATSIGGRQMPAGGLPAGGMGSPPGN